MPLHYRPWLMALLIGFLDRLVKPLLICGLTVSGLIFEFLVELPFIIAMILCGGPHHRGAEPPPGA